jgi:uncharacterized protein YcfJ
MNKSMVMGIVIGGAAATAVGGMAGYEVLNKQPAYADVLKAEPVYKTIKIPHQECNDELVVHKAPVKDQERVAGTAIGAVLGGLIGNQFGGGNGKTLTTVGGAVAGGYAGNQVQKGMQDRDVQTSKETHCKTVYENHKQSAGYKVTYRLGKQEGVVQMDHDPGTRIPVKDGQLVLHPDNKSANS